MIPPFYFILGLIGQSLLAIFFVLADNLDLSFGTTINSFHFWLKLLDSRVILQVDDGFLYFIHFVHFIIEAFHCFLCPDEISHVLNMKVILRAFFPDVLLIYLFLPI